MIPILLIISYIICGILAYGMNFGYFRNSYPTLGDYFYKLDLIDSVVVGFFGWFGLIMTIIWIKYFSIYGFKGFRYK